MIISNNASICDICRHLNIVGTKIVGTNLSLLSNTTFLCNKSNIIDNRYYYTNDEYDVSGYVINLS
jgi:hypothetical protein